MNLDKAVGLIGAVREALRIVTDYVQVNHIKGGFFGSILRKGREIGLWKIGQGPLVVVLGLLLAGCAGTLWYPWARPLLPGNPVGPPVPTPTPILPTPTPEPTPTPVPPPPPPPLGENCPPLAAIKVAWIGGTATGTVLDATPLTSREFCTGIFQGRMFCPLGVENTPERVHCEARRIGGAGPIWMRECEGGDDIGCVVVQGNRYLAKVRGPGPFRACSAVEPVCGVSQ